MKLPNPIAVTNNESIAQDNSTTEILALESLRLEASNALTSPQRLSDIFESLPDVSVARAIAQNPNTPTELLWKLAAPFPRDVLENPILPLLHLEDANIGNKITKEAALGFLCLNNLPTWILQATQGIQLKIDSLIREALQQHRQLVGVAGNNWKQIVHTAFLQAAKNDALPTLYYRNNHVKQALENQLLPAWVAHLVVEAVNNAGQQEYQVANLADTRPPLSTTTFEFHNLKTDGNGHKQANRDALLAVDNLHAILRQREAARSASTVPHNPQYSIQHPEITRHKNARKKDTAPDTLSSLANDEARVVRMTVARHPNTPPQVLAQLATDADSRVRGALTRNQQLSIDLLEQLATDPHCIVRANVARHPLTPPHLIHQLANDEDGMVLHALLHRPHLALETRTVAMQRQKGITVWGNSCPANEIAGSAQTPPHVLDALARLSDKIACSVARNRKAAKETLRLLATSANENVRAAVAANPHTPTDVLTQLGGDTFAVRNGLANNTATPIGLLLQLVDDDKPLPNGFHENLAGNAALPLLALEKLLRKIEIQIRKIAVRQALGIASGFSASYGRQHFDASQLAECRQRIFAALLGHPHGTNGFREQVRELRQKTWLFDLAASHSIFVRSIALSNPEMPLEILEANLYAPQWVWRVAITRNPATPVPLLKILADDGNRFVSASALERLAIESPRP